MNPVRKRFAWWALPLLALQLAASSGARAQPADPPLELLVLGSGGPGATGRAASCYLVLVDGVARILVDAGPGAFARLGEANVSLSGLDVVLLTHLHVDHAGELAGLFKARAVSGGDPVTFNIWGPTGAEPRGGGAYFPSTSRFIELLFGKRGAFAYLRDFATPLSFAVHDLPVRLVPDGSAQLIYQQDGLVIRSIAGHHADAPAVMYRIEHGGRSITFSGDFDAQSLPDLRRIAAGSDLLVVNTVVLDPPGSRAVLYTLHTPPGTIGEIAKTAGVHGLLLSHLSPAVERSQDEVLQSIRRNYAGAVRFAADGIRVTP